MRRLFCMVVLTKNSIWKFMPFLVAKCKIKTITTKAIVAFLRRKFRHFHAIYRSIIAAAEH